MTPESQRPTNSHADTGAPHRPVLLAEVLDALAIAPGEIHVDGTFGAGGYSSAMAARGARVFAIDQDPDAIAEGQAVVAASGGAITLVRGNFGEMGALLDAAGVADEAPELLFAQAIVEEKLLLLLELRSVLGELFAGFGLAMLAGGVVALLQRSGLAQAGQLDAEGALHFELRAVAHVRQSFTAAT